MGKIAGIATHQVRRGDMETHQQAPILFASGVGNDFRGKKQGKRQVTILGIESWQAACQELGVELPWYTRRANLLVSGLDLENTTGKILQIGGLRLEITGELEPCERMNDEQPGLRGALDQFWRGGVCCRILSEGQVAVGDQINFD